MSRYFKLVGRALRLVCPVCGRGPLFRGLLSMHETCPQCGAKFEREPGFFLGSIYINYGITAVATLVGYLAMMFSNVPKEEWQRFAILISVAIILPLLLHRHARSLWLGFDQWQDPRPGEE
jgi:uncharacterized protein (DUF983 family)